MLIPYMMLFIAGLICLIKGSDYVTVYASKAAKHFGVSELVIGITVVAMSTSLPELTVSVFSIFFESSQIATGTIIGSNIANICLIVGISAAIYPMKTDKGFLRQGIVTFIFTAVVFLFLLDGMVLYEGIIIIAGFVVYMYYLIRIKRRAPVKKKGVSEKTAKRRKKTAFKHVVQSIVGGLIVVAGANTLIYSTINMAGYLGISELLISLIAIAIGTSLPELAVSFTAALKKLEGISIGNILGSNIFNISILGMVSLFSVVPVTESLVFINLPIMVISVLALLLFMKTKWKITRPGGVVLLLMYATFIMLQFV